MRAFSSLLLLLAASSLTAACHAGGSVAEADILLYDGTGTSRGDVEAVAAILADNHLSFARVGSGALETMTEPALRRYRLIIVPGGDFVAMAARMSPQTNANVRGAVRAGVNYLGICGGGFLAGRVYDKGFDLASGAKFGFYSAARLGIRKAAVPIASVGGPALDQYWEDGPEFTGWGAPIARYPDGKPAIVEGSFGAGRVILAGVHAEAPESWRAGLRFTTSVGADHDYAARLIRAALAGREVAHY